ncbi:MAG: Jag N-terminal domain-containing protein [Coriobacteriales bacterium]|jgi:spoIIIJ-associated protein|nr:Jag N-terminal domain-containing protein [Coriobacteriales bacterium]
MRKELVAAAPTVEEAIERALAEMDVQREDVEVEVIKEPTKRFFGEARDAEVRVTLLSSDFEDDEDGDEDPDEDGALPKDREQSDSDEGPDEESEDMVADEAEDDLPPSEDPPEENERNFNRALPQLSDEEVDTIADTAIEAIQSMLGYFGIQDATIEEFEGEEGELILDIGGNNLAILIGRHGKTLESLQFIVSSIVGKKTGYRFPVIIDIEGYKHRRKQKLVSIARSSAARAIRQKQQVDLRPMSPYERRIVHVALKDDKRITTHSEGAEPNRYVVIRLT